MLNDFVESVIDQHIENKTQKLCLTLDEKHRFLIKEMIPSSYNEETKDDCFCYKAAMYRAVIKVAQYFLEKDFNVSYDFIWNYAFSKHYHIDDVIQHYGFQSIELNQQLNTFIDEEEQLHINQMKELINYRIHLLYKEEGAEVTGHYKPIHMPITYIELLYISLNAYKFKNINIEIAKLFLISAPDEDFDLTLQRITMIKNSDYTYEQILDLYLSFIIEFF